MAMANATSRSSTTTKSAPARKRENLDKKMMEETEDLAKQQE
jgi:hypothetical protein